VGAVIPSRDQSFEAAYEENNDEEDGGVPLPASIIDSDNISPEDFLVTSASEQTAPTIDNDHLDPVEQDVALDSHSIGASTDMATRPTTSRSSSRRNSRHSVGASSTPIEDVDPNVPPQADASAFNPQAQAGPALERTYSQIMFEMDEDQPFHNDYSSVHGVCHFLNMWRNVYINNPQIVDHISDDADKPWVWDRPKCIEKNDLKGDRNDMQGINWEELGTTRTTARRARERLYLYGEESLSNLHVFLPFSISC